MGMLDFNRLLLLLNLYFVVFVTPLEGCDVTYTVPSGTITSPNWPKKYDDNMDCTYIIDIPNGVDISISVVVFKTEKSTDLRDGDVLYYGSGVDADINKADESLSGYIDPSAIHVDNGTMWLRFISNERTTFNGFQLNYFVATTDCSGFSSEPTGNFSSPNYPAEYPNSVSCQYVVDVPGTVVFNVKFSDFKLEQNNDLLYYGNGTSPNTDEAIGILTGLELPDPLEIRDQTVWFIFESDYDLVYKGFLLTWRATDEATCQIPASYPNAEYILDESNPYNEGSYVIYSCLPGYQMDGDAESIVQICRFEDGGLFAKWDGPEVSCTIIQCPEPPIPVNGTYDRDHFDFGRSILYRCDEGFVLTGGNSTRLCTANGTWSGEEVKCVPDLSGLCDPSSLKYNNYNCYKPYNNTYKTWNNARLACENLGQDTTLAIIKDNSTQTYLEKNLPEVGTDEYGYWIGAQEARKWIWENSGRNINFFSWTTTEPDNAVNVNEDCIALSPLNDDNFNWADEKCDINNKDSTPFYFICQFDRTCPGIIAQPIIYGLYCLGLVENQQSKDSAKNYCKDNGGRLVEIDSSDMQNFIRAQIEGRMGGGLRTAYWWIGASVNRSARYWEWLDGTPVIDMFWGSGEPTSFDEDCLDLLQEFDFKWNDDGCFQPRGYICQIDYPVAGCGYPGEPANGQTSSSPDDESKVGDITTVECDPGYALQGPSQRTCTTDGEWSDNPTTCTKLACNVTDIPTLPEADYDILSYEFRGVVVYQCLESAELVGYPAIYCNETAQWSHLEANCTALEISTPLMTSQPSSTLMEATTSITTLSLTTVPTTVSSLSTAPGTTTAFIPTIYPTITQTTTSSLSTAPGTTTAFITTTSPTIMQTTTVTTATSLSTTPGTTAMTSLSTTTGAQSMPSSTTIATTATTTGPSSTARTTTLTTTAATTGPSSTPSTTALATTTTAEDITPTSMIPASTTRFQTPTEGSFTTITEPHKTSSLSSSIPTTTGSPTTKSTTRNQGTSLFATSNKISIATTPTIPEEFTSKASSSKHATTTVGISSSPNGGGQIENSSSTLVIIIVSVAVGVLLVLLLLIVLLWLCSCRNERNRRQKAYARQQSDIASVSGPSTRRFSHDNNNIAYGTETSFENPAEFRRGYSLQSRQSSMDALISPDSISHQLSMLSNTYENPLFGRTPVRVEQRVSFEYGNSLPLSSMSGVNNTRSVVRPGFTLESAQSNSSTVLPHAKANTSSASSFSGSRNSLSYAHVNPASTSNLSEAGDTTYNTTHQIGGAPSRMPPYAQVNRAAKTSHQYGRLQYPPMNRDEGVGYNALQRFQIDDAATSVPMEPPPDYDSLDDEKLQLKAMFRDEHEYNY